MRETTRHPYFADSGPLYLVRLAALATAVLLLVFGSGALFATESEETAAYIVKGKSVERVREIVVEVGGEVTHELKIIRSVGARLTDQQRDTLVEHPEISRVWEDREAEVQSTGGKTVFDSFDNSSFSNDDGPDSWTGSWQENASCGVTT